MRTTLLKVMQSWLWRAFSPWHNTEIRPTRRRWRSVTLDFLTKQLSLTPQQQQQASTIFSEAANNAKATHDQMRTAHDSLKAAIQKNDSCRH